MDGATDRSNVSDIKASQCLREVDYNRVMQVVPNSCENIMVLLLEDDDYVAGGCIRAFVARLNVSTHNA